MKLPASHTEVEASCCHHECTQSLFQEILRTGSWDAEDICLVAERAEDARSWALEATEEDFRRF